MCYWVCYHSFISHIFQRIAPFNGVILIADLNSKISSLFLLYPIQRRSRNIECWFVYCLALAVVCIIIIRQVEWYLRLVDYHFKYDLVNDLSAHIRGMSSRTYFINIKHLESIIYYKLISKYPRKYILYFIIWLIYMVNNASDMDENDVYLPQWMNSVQKKYIYNCCHWMTTIVWSC